MTKRRFRRVPAFKLKNGDPFWSNKSGQEFRRIRSNKSIVYIHNEEIGVVGISRDDWYRITVWVEVTNGKN